MRLMLVIAIGGALGAVSRHYFAAVVNRGLAYAFGYNFPYGIFAVNILGSFLMGLLVSLAAYKLDISPEMRGFLAVGFLGAFTTFSTYSLDIVLLLERGQYMMAVLYAGGSVILGILGLMCGMWIGRVIL